MSILLGLYSGLSLEHKRLARSLKHLHPVQHRHQQVHSLIFFISLARVPSEQSFFFLAVRECSVLYIMMSEISSG